MAGRLGIPATIFVPEWVDPVKLAGITAAGAAARREGESFDDAEASALAYARDVGATYVSAYDDPHVIAGQGTIAFEIADALGGPPAEVVAPLSGGGLIGGIAAAFAAVGEDRPRIVAASAERAAVMLASVRAGRPVELPEEETLANALAGGIGPDNRHSFPLVRDRVDAHVTVTEAEIAAAIRYAVERLRLVVEGGGAVALAALLGADAAPEGHEGGAGRRGPLVAVLSGGNVGLDTLARVPAG